MTERIDALVDGGKASAGPPIGPALGPHGLNVGEVINTINEKTKAFAGMKVPVAIVIDPKKKSFEIEVGTPPASALIIKQLNIPKGSGSAATDKVADMSIEDAIAVANMKESNLLGADLRARVREILGTCVSMGVTVDGGKDPRDVQRAIRAGEYDDQIPA